jgi:competence protein ComEC
MRHRLQKLKQKKILVFISCLCIFVFGSLCAFYKVSKMSFIRQQAPLIKVLFLNVGQGDSILVQAPNGTTLLVDGGKDRELLRELGTVLPFSKSHIDIVIATHPDADHIGGLPFLFPYYTIGSFFYTGAESETDIDSITKYIFQKNSTQTKEIDMPQRIVLDAESGVYADILFPDRKTTNWETNSASVVVRIVYNKISILLTGDLPVSGEEYLVSNYGNSLQSTVLKLGHHGSRTSSAPVFLKTVQPEYTIVSAGRDNDYGHPHAEVLDRVKNTTKAQILDTKNGRVICESDGEKVDCKNKI